MSDRVLVVEDEDIIRNMTVEFLEEAGLNVMEANTADAALRILEVDGGEICLLFTDVRMPGRLDGLELARTTMVRWPHIKIIVTSGMFTKASGTVPKGAEFLPKPWMPLDMLTRVMRVATSHCD